MLFCLGNIYNDLHKNSKNKENYFFKEKWDIDLGNDLQENPIEYFYHPATVRWLLPVLRGKAAIRYDEEQEKIVFHRQSSPPTVKIHPATVRLFHPTLRDEVAFSYDEKKDQIVFHQQSNPPIVKSQTDFLRLHFEPVFKELESCSLNDTSLKDIMGRHIPFKGCGSTLRKILISNFTNPEMLRKMVITQQTILEQYDYRACDLRRLIISFIDRALNPEDPNDPADTTLINNGLLLQIRTVLLNLLTRGNDAAALACLLLCAALREWASPILLQFMGNNFDVFFLTEEPEPGRIEMGDGFYLTYGRRRNYIGGDHETDITLWQSPDTMIEKISDCSGYFFYPVQLDEPFQEQTQRCGPQIQFRCDFSPFDKEKSLITWTYQPDGRYFADDDGFGAEDCDEIILYALMDKGGRIVTPFSRENPLLKQAED